MGVLLFLINIQSEVIGPVEVIGLGDAWASRRAAAARGEQHSAVVHADIIDHRKAIVCHSLFKGPEKIVGRGHEQRAVLDRVLLIPAEGRVLVLFGDAVKALYKGLRAGRYRPEKEGRRKDQQIGGLYIGNDVVEIVLLDTWLAVTAGIAAETSVDRLFRRDIVFTLCPAASAPRAKASASCWVLPWTRPLSRMIRIFFAICSVRLSVFLLSYHFLFALSATYDTDLILHVPYSDRPPMGRHRKRCRAVRRKSVRTSHHC